MVEVNPVTSTIMPPKFHEYAPEFTEKLENSATGTSSTPSDGKILNQHLTTPLWEPS